MSNSEPPIYYLVGTPKRRLSKLEAGRAFGLIDLKLPKAVSSKRKPKMKRPTAKKPKTKLNFSF
jgi:hypothetical protein